MERRRCLGAGTPGLARTAALLLCLYGTGSCDGTGSPGVPVAPPAPRALADLDALWDYDDPGASEARFRERLQTLTGAQDAGARAELLTQIARAQGLQQRFDAAHATLDAADASAGSAGPRARVRALLERGRVVHSSGDAEGSIPLFERALKRAQADGLESFAVDAAHMLGIVAPGDEALRWNERAIALAEAAQDPDARRWLGALYNNQGWNLHERGRHAEARELFERHLAYREARGERFQASIARWSIAKMDRFLGDPERALGALRALLDHPDRQGGPAEGYTHEEIGECLLALDRAEEARPHFARAWEQLHDDPWLQRDEAPRLARLRELGGLN